MNYLEIPTALYINLSMEEVDELEQTYGSIEAIPYEKLWRETKTLFFGMVTLESITENEFGHSIVCFKEVDYKVPILLSYEEIIDRVNKHNTNIAINIADNMETILEDIEEPKTNFSKKLMELQKRRRK